MRTKVTWLATVFLMVAFCFPAAAQENFTQAVTPENGSFTVRIPEDWVWNEQAGMVVVANSDAALDRVAKQDDLEPEDRLLFLMSPNFIEQELGATAESDLASLVEPMLKGITGSLAPEFDDGEVFTMDDGRATIVAQSSANSPIGSGYIIIDNGDGRFFGAIAITTPEDIEAYGATLAAIVLTVDLPTLVPDIDLERYRQWAVSGSATSQYGGDSYSAMQAAGAPNTYRCEDVGTAWASESSTGVDTLTLNYTTPVIPAEINIYQTLTPGAIVSVELVTAEHGDVITLPNSLDAPGKTPCPGVFTIPINDELPFVNQIIIHLDQTLVGYWNEIDAVELVGKPPRPMGFPQWADAATATSEFSDSGWSAMQAAGRPGVFACGDNTTAWASKEVNGADSLTLTYDVAVVPSQINIYETYNPGSITSVEVVTEAGDVIEIENSADPVGRTPCPGVLTLDITGAIPAVNQVIIHVDQTKLGNWNEIDAVELVGIPEQP